MVVEKSAQQLRGAAGSVYLWACVLCAGCLLYGLTAQQAVSWQDSGMLQYRILAGDYTGRLGLALAHPLYIAIGRLFLLIPFGSEAALMCLCSGAGMALTLANVAVLAVMLTGKRWIGIMTAAMLSVMHTPWWLATITEVYTWNTAFFSAELVAFLALMRNPSMRRAAGLFLLTGLDISIHNLSFLGLPVYCTAVVMLVWRRRLPTATVPLAGVACICGAAPLLWLVVREALHGGGLFSAFASMLFGRYAAQVFNAELTWNLMGVNAALSSLNFVHAGTLLGAVGWVHMARRAGRVLAAFFGALFVLHAFFFLRYPVPDQFTFILPSLVLFCLGIAAGIDVFARRTAVWRKAVIAACVLSIAVMPASYAALPLVLEAFNVRVQRSRILPFRDEVRYWIVPWKHNEDSAERFARAALSEAAPDGVIVCDSTSYYPLLLLRDRTPGAAGVLLESAGAMKSLYGTDPASLARLLREQRVFLVSPALNFVSSEFRQDFQLARGEDATLWMLTPQKKSVEGDS